MKSFKSTGARFGPSHAGSSLCSLPKYFYGSAGVKGAQKPPPEASRGRGAAQLGDILSHKSQPCWEAGVTSPSRPLAGTAMFEVSERGGGEAGMVELKRETRCLQSTRRAPAGQHEPSARG